MDEQRWKELAGRVNKVETEISAMKMKEDYATKVDLDKSLGTLKWLMSALIAALVLTSTVIGIGIGVVSNMSQATGG